MLAQLLDLRLKAGDLGDVARDSRDADRQSFLVANELEPGVEKPDLVVGGAMHGDRVVTRRLVERLEQSLHSLDAAEDPVVARGERLMPGAPDEQVDVPAEEPFTRGVDRGEPSGEVQLVDDLGRVFDDVSIVFL